MLGREFCNLFHSRLTVPLRARLVSLSGFLPPHNGNAHHHFAVLSGAVFAQLKVFNVRTTFQHHHLFSALTNQNIVRTFSSSASPRPLVHTWKMERKQEAAKYSEKLDASVKPLAMPELNTHMPEIDHTPESFISAAVKSFEGGDARVCCELLYGAASEEIKRFSRARGITVTAHTSVDFFLDFVANEWIEDAVVKKNFLNDWKAIQEGHHHFFEEPTLQKIRNSYMLSTVEFINKLRELDGKKLPFDAIKFQNKAKEQSKWKRN